MQFPTVGIINVPSGVTVSKKLAGGLIQIFTERTSEAPMV